jgi:hypothetical protein
VEKRRPDGQACGAAACFSRKVEAGGKPQQILIGKNDYFC